MIFWFSGDKLFQVSRLIKFTQTEGMKLEEQILTLINEHPEGIKLTEIEKALGVARIKAGNITRVLVDEGKVRKEGLLYFPK